jgi:hypothetical protein
MKTTHTLLITIALMLSFTASAQWVKQNIPTTQGTINEPRAVSKNVMWLQTNDFIRDTSKVTPIEYLRTADGGKSYKKGQIEPDNDVHYFYHLQPIDAQTAYLIGGRLDGSYFVRRTVDSGATWTNTPFLPTTFPDLIYFYDANNGIYVGDPDSLGMYIAYTVNGGNTFIRLPSTNVPHLDPDELGDTGNYMILGDNIFMNAFRTSDYSNRIWRSVDRGRNWTAGEWFSTNDVLVARFTFTDANNGMVLRGVANETQKPLITTDGGASWHEGYDMPDYVAYPVKGIPNTQTMVSIFQDTIRRMAYTAATNDLGKTWHSKKDIAPYTLDSIYVGFGDPPFVFSNLSIVDNNTAWAKIAKNELLLFNSTTPLVSEKPDLDLTITADNDGLPLWNYVKFTLTIKNRGISKATGIKANWLPPYKRVDNGGEPFANVGAYSSKGNYNWWSGDWDISELAAGESATATFHLFVVKNNQNVTQTAQITACNELDLDSSPNNMVGNTAKEDDETSFTSLRPVALVEPAPKGDPSVSALKISPNPAKDKAFLAINDKTNAAWTIEVVNNLGQVVFSKSEQQNGLLELNTQDFKNGLYLVHLTNGTEKRVEKLMVQH